MRSINPKVAEALKAYQEYCKERKAMCENFNPSKPVQTRDGCPARILASDVKGSLPIVALVQGADETEILYQYHKDGRANSYYDVGRDLVNIPEITYKYKPFNKKKVKLSNYSFDSYKAAKNHQTYQSQWDSVVKVKLINDEFASLVLLKEDDCGC
jgi:hypothetical protein